MGISPICCRLAFIAIDEVRFPKQEDAELNQQNWMESYPSEAVIIITDQKLLYVSEQLIYPRIPASKAIWIFVPSARRAQGTMLLCIRVRP